MSALFPPSRLTCERCHGHGHVRTSFGPVACLECDSASPWKPASQPPACEPGSHGGISIECVGLVGTGAGRGPEIVAYWPAVDKWTISCEGPAGEYFDEDIEVSYWLELPEMPMDDRRGPDPETSEMFAKTHRNRAQFSVENVSKALSAALAKKQREEQ